MRRPAYSLAAATVTALAVAAACAPEPTSVPRTSRASVHATASAAPNATPDANVERDLAALRRAVAPFHRFEAASDAGWSAKITSCMADPAAGGMGFHYGNVGLIDGAVRVDEPELLLYEPERNGRLRLVAVEYVIPYTLHSRAAEPPVLFGQPFARNDRFQLWGLHAWVGEHNPSGTFASWNPRVTCAYTTDLDVAPMNHG
jgi:hypothetical protein